MQSHFQSGCSARYHYSLAIQVHIKMLVMCLPVILRAVRRAHGEHCGIEVPGPKRLTFAVDKRKKTI